MISFHFTKKFNLKPKLLIKKWIKFIIEHNNYKVGNINLIFVDDEHLLKINKKYLNHDYYTDIITFNFNKNNTINSDIFISIDRIKDNAHKFKTTEKEELLRVIVHGILHLVGLDDTTKEQKAFMRQKENYYLDLIDINIIVYDK